MGFWNPRAGLSAPSLPEDTCARRRLRGQGHQALAWDPNSGPVAQGPGRQLSARIPGDGPQRDVFLILPKS